MGDPIVERLLAALEPVEEVTALVLGGSRGRGTASPSSDYDFGLYYEPSTPLDIAKLKAALAPLLGDPADAKLTEIGGWGPWINGGGWLNVSGQKVDLLYRDLARVGAVVADCKAGRISMHYQPGHPHGFCSAIWMGEVALCRPLLDRTGALGQLKAQTSPFPDALRGALISKFHWEVLFSIENAELAIARGEQTHIAGCAHRALCCVAQVLFAVNGRYLINEKGALAEAGQLPATVEGADGMAAEIWAAVGAKDFHRAMQHLRAIAMRLDRIVADAGC